MRGAAFIAALALLAGCSGGGGGSTTGACTGDTDCPLGAFCQKASGAQSGLCACRTDEACQKGEICNSQGICQRRLGCRSNAECDRARFCDILSGQCIDRTSCGADFHCLPGSVCDNHASPPVCVEGCFTDADCELYSICDHTGSSSSNVMGRCLAGACNDKSYCDFGQSCTMRQCVRAVDPNHCAPCDPNMLGSCGSTHNYCLVNSAYSPSNPSAGSQYYCGVECKQESDCPSGYTCGGVILLTQDQCMHDAECGGGGRKCVVGEADLKGFCTCVQDSECTQDKVPPHCNGPGGCDFPIGQPCTSDAQCQAVPLCADLGTGTKMCINNLGGQACNASADCLCDPQQHVCFRTGRPCMTSQDCLLSCVMEGGVGGCLLGSACAPQDGLYCPQLRK